MQFNSTDHDEQPKSDEVRAGEGVAEKNVGADDGQVLGANEVTGWDEIEDADDTSDLDADLFDGQFDTHRGHKIALPGKKRGRKKGSKNRSTSDLARFVKANYRSPLLALMDISAMTPKQVAWNWNLKPGEAAKFWLGCVSKALEYIEQRQPQAVIVAGINWQKIDMGLGAPPADEDGLGFGLGAAFAPLERSMKSVGYQNSGSGVAQEGVAQDD